MQLDSIIYNLPAHVYWKDKNGVYLGCNDRQAKSLGLASHDDIIGKTDYDFSPKEEADKFRENDLKVLNSKTPYIVEEIKITSDDSIITYLSQKVPIFDINNNVIGILGISFDITERKRQEEELEATFHSVLGNLPEHVYWLDKNNIFLGCNKKQADTFGLDSPNQIKGKSVYDFETKKDADFITKVNNEIMRTGKSVSIEEPFLSPQGEHKVFLSKKQPLLDKKNNIMGILGISFDITAEKEAAQLRIEKETIEEREATTKLIAASMAHELRTPLSTIELSLESMNHIFPSLMEIYEKAKDSGMDVPYFSPMQLKSYNHALKNSKMEARSALSVIDMLLMTTNTSHINTEKFRTLAMADCIKEALTRYPLLENDIKIIHCKKPDFNFVGDDILMTHIIFNLLKNALYYIKSCGKGEIFIWAEHNDNFNILHFKDTGQGMDKEVLSHIFERFFTRTRHGSGVGLAFCKLVMQSFGGDITCDSVKGEYSDFIMTFPRIA